MEIALYTVIALYVNSFTYVNSFNLCNQTYTPTCLSFYKYFPPEKNFPNVARR